MKTSDLLNESAGVLMERGLWKGDPNDGGGGTCVAYAIMYASERGGNQRQARDYVLDVLDQPHGNSEPIFDWNDRPETTLGMALGALHEAALLAKEQGD